MVHSSEERDSPTNPAFETLGWDEDWEFQFSPYKGPYIPGRITTVHKTRYEVMTPREVLSLPVSGALKTKKMFPVVGDFVVVLNDEDSARRMIVSILNRRTCLSRGGAGEHAGKQTLAANIDIAFIVSDPGPDFSISRILRYLMIVRSSGAKPVIILNKADTSDEIESKIEDIRKEIPDVPIVAISALHNTGLYNLSQFLIPGKTVIFLGSSGVGKSTLMNALTGSSLQETGEIREDDGKGRHTTTVRHLVLLPGGCSIIDTPGLREIRIWTAEEQVTDTFADIVEIASHCKFSDCTHQQEPGCAIRKAIEEERLSPERMERYQKILKEISFERDKAEIGLKRMEKRKYKGISELAKTLNEQKKRTAHQ